ncbi:MAG: glutamate--tRNA ligase [Longimicrobiales bacterium]
MTLRVRFAPSPTGYLHVGGARTALFNWLLARREGGVFVLRIEDTDRDRSREEHTRAILDGLGWLGMGWDEGPFFQSQGLERHRADALNLLESDQAYRDFSTLDEAEGDKKADMEAGRRLRGARKRAEARSREEEETLLAAGRPFAVRFRVPEGETRWVDGVHGEIRFRNEEIDDLVILRSDGTPTYNLAVVSDDVEMGITMVLRGDDHLSNTPKQILLYEALGRPVPSFGHVPMILGPDGKRLSKRHGATAVGEYAREGILSEAMFNFLALLGWSPGDDREVLTRQELVEAFSVERILKKSSVFDPEKLAWLNGQHLMRTETAVLVEDLEARLETLGVAEEVPEGEEPLDIQYLVELLKPRSRTLEELLEQAVPYLRARLTYDPVAVEKQWKKDPEAVAERLQRVRDALAETEWTADSLERTARDLAREMEVGLGKILQPLRVALTGSSASPGMFDVLLLLGPGRSMDRIETALAYLEREL